PGGRVGPSGRRARMKVDIVRLPDLHVAFMRHVGPYRLAGRTWEALLMELAREGRLGGQPTLVGICYDDPDVTTPSKIRYDACITVDGEFQGSEDIGVQDLPGGAFAMITHVGPYTRLGET